MDRHNFYCTFFLKTIVQHIIYNIELKHQIARVRFEITCTILYQTRTTLSSIATSFNTTMLKSGVNFPTILMFNFEKPTNLIFLTF